MNDEALDKIERRSVELALASPVPESTSFPPPPLSRDHALHAFVTRVVALEELLHEGNLAERLDEIYEETFSSIPSDEPFSSPVVDSVAPIPAIPAGARAEWRALDMVNRLYRGPVSDMPDSEQIIMFRMTVCILVNVMLGTSAGYGLKVRNVTVGLVYLGVKMLGLSVEKLSGQIIEWAKIVVSGTYEEYKKGKPLLLGLWTGVFMYGLCSMFMELDKIRGLALMHGYLVGAFLLLAEGSISLPGTMTTSIFGIIGLASAQTHSSNFFRIVASLNKLMCIYALYVIITNPAFRELFTQIDNMGFRDQITFKWMQDTKQDAKIVLKKAALSARRGQSPRRK